MAGNYVGIPLVLPDQTGNSGKYLTTDGTTVSWATVSSGGTPGGSTTQLQYNNAGSFGGMSGFTYDGTDLTSTQSFFENGTLGTELITNGTFTGSATGWTLAAGWAYTSNTVQHSSNGTGTLTPTTPLSIVSGTRYRLQFTISTMTGVTGTIVAALGGVTMTTLTAEATSRTYLFDFTASATTNLTFTPSNTARFTIDDISLKPVVGEIRTYRDINLSTPNAATPNNQQASPYLHYKASGWKTTTTAAAQSVDFRSYLLPIQASANPLSRLLHQYSVNGGAYSEIGGIDSTGLLYATNFTSEAGWAGTNRNEHFGYLSAVTAGNTNQTAFGNQAQALATGSVAVGTLVQINASATGTLIMGANSSAGASAVQNVIIGTGITTNSANVTSIGAQTVIGNANTTIVGFQASGGGDSSTAVGRSSSSGGPQSTAIGYGANASNTGSLAAGLSTFAVGTNSTAIGTTAYAGVSNSTAIGYNATVNGNVGNICIGYAVANNYTGSGTACLIGNDNLFIGAVIGSIPVTGYIRTLDIITGTANQTGSDLIIQPGLSSGAAGGGTFYIKQTPPGNTPGVIANTTVNEHVKVEPNGTATFTGENDIQVEPTSQTFYIEYRGAGFTSGIPTSGATRDYQVYAYNGVPVYSSAHADGTVTDDGSTVNFSFSGPNANTPSASASASSYNAGDNVDYQVWQITKINGNDLYVQYNSTGTISVPNTGDDITVTWNGEQSAPSDSTDNWAFISRQVNGGGYNDHQLVALGTNTLTDTGSGWTGGGSPSGSTSVQNFYRVQGVWAAGLSSTGSKVLRQINGGGFSAAQDTGGTASVTDDGTGFGSSITITPTSVANFKVKLNQTTTPIEVLDTSASSLYKFPLVQPTTGQTVYASSAGILAWGDLTNMSGVLPIANGGGLSGTYTPTLSNTTNVSASTARQCTYMRVGNTVTVSGQLDIDPTTTLTATLLGISLPIASSLSTVYQLAGTASSMNIANESAGIEADPTNDRASLRYIAVDVTNHPMTFTFTYEVI
jgi:hypothetical protein